MHSYQIPEWMSEPRKGQEWSTYFKKYFAYGNLCARAVGHHAVRKPNQPTLWDHMEMQKAWDYTERGLQPEPGAPGLTTTAPAKWISWEAPNQNYPAELYPDTAKPWKVMCCYFKPLLFYTEIKNKTLGKQLSDER